MLKWVVQGGVLDDPSDGRSFTGIQLAGWLREVAMRCDFYAVGLRAEVRDVEISLEDLLLDPLLFQTEGVSKFADLSTD